MVDKQENIDPERSKPAVDQMAVKQENIDPERSEPAFDHDIPDELDLKAKKYMRGDGANLEALQDKKLKGQLAVREKLYGQSAKAAAKAEKVRETVRDVVFLQNEQFFAVAQKKFYGFGD